MKRDGQSSITPSDSYKTDTRTETEGGAPASSYDGMPPPPKPSVSNTALTKQNLNEALAASRPDSINDRWPDTKGLHILRR